MRKSSAVLLLSVVIGAPAVFAELPALDFDQGLSASAIVGEARREALKETKPVRAASIVKRDEGFGCHDFSFKADSPDASETATLQGIRYARVCRPVGDPAHGGTVECKDEAVGVNTVDARVILRDRKPLLPSEVEVFRVCLEGESLNWQAVTAVYEYHQADEGGRGDIVLVPGGRVSKP